MPPKKHPARLYLLMKLLVILGIGTLFVSCAKSEHLSNAPANSASKALLTDSADVQYRGTVDGGGGGDADGAYDDVSETDVENAITALPEILNYVFYAHEGYALPYLELKPKMGPVLMAVYTKIYSAKNPDLYATLKNLKFVPKRGGPCHDLNFADKDGSAFNSDPNEICLSVPRIKAKLRKVSLAAEILGLAGHEVAHRMGADENEATALQEAIALSFKVKQLDGLPIAMANRQGLLQNLIQTKDFEKIQSFFGKGKKPGRKIPDTEFCRVAGDWSRSVDQFLNDASSEAEKWGISGLRLQAVVHISAMSDQVAAMLDYCNEEVPPCNIPRRMSDNGYCGKVDKKPFSETRNEPFSLDFLLLNARSWTDGPLKIPGRVRTTYYLDKNAASFNFDEALGNFRAAEDELDLVKHLRELP